jgi:hypothetical protein
VFSYFGALIALSKSIILYQYHPRKAPSLCGAHGGMAPKEMAVHYGQLYFLNFNARFLVNEHDKSG